MSNPIDPSRRIALRVLGFAGTAVAAPGAALSVASHGAALSVISPDRLSAVWRAVGQRDGGFPSAEITSLMRMINGPSKVDPSSILDRLLGHTPFLINEELVGIPDSYNTRRLRFNGKHGAFSRVNMKEKAGKINFSDEARIVKHLWALPADVPIMDLLDDQILQDLETPKGRMFDLSMQDVAVKVREFLGPVCNATTTPRDLLERFKDFLSILVITRLKSPMILRCVMSWNACVCPICPAYLMASEGNHMKWVDRL